jgi:PAS domain S-box-containing protein
MTTAVVRDAQGMLAYCVTHVQDVTERKRAEEALRENERKFKALFDNCRDAILVYDMAGHFADANREACERLGYSREELLRMGPQDIDSPEAAARVPARLQELSERGHALFETEHQRRDGTRVLVELNCSLVELEGSKLAFSTCRDITERKRAQEALQESEARFRAAFEQGASPMVLTVPDGTILKANPAFCQMLGYTEAELRERTFLEITHPEDRAASRTGAERIARDEQAAFRMEKRYLRKDGRAIWGDVNAAVVRDAQGRLLHLVAHVQDITARKQAEANLRESEERFRTLFEEAPIAIGLACNGVNLCATKKFLETFGLKSFEEIRGRPLVEQWAPQCRAEIAERARRRKLGLPAPTEYETTGLRANGAEFPARVEVARVLLPEGPASLGFITDLTEKRRAEEALRDAKARLAQAVRVAGLGIFEHDHRSDVVEYSPVMREMAGFGRKEPLTIEAILQRVAPEDRERVEAAMERAHDPAGDGRYEMEHRVVLSDGRIRWLSKRSQTFFEGEGSQRRPMRTIGAALDVTERRKVQAELERLVGERTEKLQEMVGELEHFSYSITHDLKAPLRAMRGFAEMASRLCADCGREEAREALARISTSAERMEGLITDALNYSRSLRQELALTDVDTGALLRGMLESYPELQPAKAQILVEGRLPVVLGNEAGLTQCFSNLLGNAVKFVKPGEKPRIHIWAEERDGWARIWVEDKGIGISKAMLPRVFDMFSRGSKDFEGTGIGLALVRKVAQRMGGRVGVESEEGKGSRFWIELELGERIPEPGRVEVATAEPTGETVLYVEDEESDAMFMKMAFAGKGMESGLRVVGDGRTAIEYLSGAGKYADRKEYPLPSMVLLDLNLPQLPGFEVLKWMRNHRDFARTPVVVFSSSTREDDRARALELGANEFVAKPNSGLKFGEVVDGLRERWMVVAVG